jgi:hypothetical protein
MRTKVPTALAVILISAPALSYQQGSGTTEQNASVTAAAEGKVPPASVSESFRSWFGYGSTWVGDVNSDGWHDVAVPDCMYPTNGEPIKSYGVVFILSGADGNVLRVIEPKGGESSFGWATAALSDLDEDGLGEVLVFGTVGRGEDSRPFARAISPATGQEHWERWDLPWKNPASGVRAAGDFNCDGDEDILVWGGVPQLPALPPGPFSRERTVVLSGRDGGLLSDVSGARYGWSCIGDACLVPDLDGDHRSDIATARNQGSDGPVVDIHSSSSGELLRQISHPHGHPLYSAFGTSLALADLDGNGTDELLIAASDSLGEALDPPAEADCVYVYDLAERDAAPVRLSVPGASGDKLIAVVPDRRGLQPTGTPVSGEALDHRWADSKALLLVADHRSYHGEVRCFSLSTGARLWNIGGRASTNLHAGRDMTSHLGEFLAIAASPDSRGFPALAGTANHYWGSDDPYIVVSFDVLTGEPRFVIDASTAHEQARTLLGQDLPK